eukprot:541915-Prymnesium_polylepis.1
MSSSERSGVACDGLHAPSPGSIPGFGAQLRGLTRAFSPSLLAGLLSEESRTSCDETFKVVGATFHEVHGAPRW